MRYRFGNYQDSGCECLQNHADKVKTHMQHSDVKYSEQRHQDYNC